MTYQEGIPKQFFLTRGKSKKKITGEKPKMIYITGEIKHY